MPASRGITLLVMFHYIYFSPFFPGLSASFPLVGFPEDGVTRKGSGGETEGDTVAPSSSLEDEGGSRVFRLFLSEIGVSGSSFL